MKKIFVSILLLILAFSYVGYFYFSVAQQHFHKIGFRKNILQNIQKKELIAVDVADYAGKILWEEKDKEFQLQGKMYDVVKTDTVCGKIIFYCVDDETEAKLVEKYTNTTNQNHSKKNNGPEKINTLFCENFAVVQSCFSFVKITGIFYTSRIKQHSQNVASPPPKV